MSERHPKAADPVPQPLELQDPVAAAATEAFGGPLGRYAGLARRGWAGAASVLVALSSIMVALGVVQKSHCVKHGFLSPHYFWRACFSDLPILFTTTPMQQGSVPYLGSAQDPPAGYGMEEPPLNGIVMWLVGLVSREAPGASGGSVVAQQAWYFGLWAALGMLLLAGAVLAATWGRPDHAWRASHLALSPVIVTAGLLSPDLLGVALMTLGLAAWSRRRLGLAGFALGLGLLSGLYPWFVVAGIVMVAGRAGRVADGLTVAGLAAFWGAVAALPLVVLGPPKDLFALGFSPENVLTPYRTWEVRKASYGSVWKALAPAIGQVRPDALTLIGWLGIVWALLVGAIVAFGLKRQVGLTPVVLAMIVTAALTGRDLPLQQALWLLPLIVFSGIPWRDHLIWAGTEALHFVAVWMHAPFNPEDGTSKALDPGWYGVFVLIRLVGIGWLLWSALHHAQDETPEEDELLAPWDTERHADFLDAAPRPVGTV